MKFHGRGSARRFARSGLAALVACWCLGSPTPARAIVAPEVESSALEGLVLVDPAIRPTVELVALDSAATLASPTAAAWSRLTALYPAAARWHAQLDRHR